MPLDQATARAAVDHWSNALLAPWSAAEKDQITARLVDLCDQMTPHIVADLAVPDDDMQRFLLARTVARLEDWLIGVAANERAALGIENNDATDNAGKLGLRSATFEEIAGLPGIGDALAADIGAYVSQRPDLDKLDPLTDIDGIGPQRLEQIKGLAYLDRPTVGLTSPSMWRFIHSPNIESFLAVLEHGDLVFVFGDRQSLPRRIPGGDTVAERFVDLIEFASEQSARTRTAVSGILASEAKQWLDRHALRHNLLGAAQAANGGLLINDAYVDSAKALIDDAAISVSLMVFLGTAAANDGLDPGPLQLVEAMEAAAARGVDVRAILDQDDGGEPYKSFFINRPLLERFKAGGVQVKFDEKDILLHSKVLVVDQSQVIVGSHNWTRTGFNNTHEMSVTADSAPVATEYQQRFDVLWDQLPNVV